nr:hypothetical protein BaRGS_003946 [Batillaria attramentaria]
MLERQRRRIDNENYLSFPPQLLGDRPLTLDDLEPWMEEADDRDNAADEVNAAWLAKTLGLDGYGGDEDLSGVLPGNYLQEEPVDAPAPLEEQPSDEELDAIFGEKNEKAADNPESSSSKEEEEEEGSLAKKDKEVLKNTQGDPTSKVAAPRSTGVVVDSSGDDGGDITLTKEEFKTLWKAVEKLQKQALDKGLAEAEAVESAVEQDMEKAEEAAEEPALLTAEPEPVSNEELDNLFEEKSEQVIPTDNGEIVETDVTLKNAAGDKVGEQETIKEVAAIPDRSSLSSLDKFWYMNNYLDPESDRKKRNSKRTPLPPALAAATFSRQAAASADSAALIEAYINKINQLQSELDQAKLVAYLEDVENDILTDALNQATLAQIDGKTSAGELRSLQDAIRVEEALQQVKAKKLSAETVATEMIEELEDAADEDEDEGEAEKRGEPWRKRADELQSEVPVYLTGDSEEDEEDEDEGDDLDEDTTALVLGQWMDKNRRQQSELSDIYGDTSDAVAWDNGDNDITDDYSRNLPALLREATNRDSSISSLFYDKPDQCPAVREFTTNCAFADQYGLPIDFEARALCNMHEMCYTCGQSLDVTQSQCDFIYRAASTMLCEDEEECVLEAEVFLRAMKLKHRYVDFSQSICSSKCTAQFLGIV